MAIDGKSPSLPEKLASRADTKLMPPGTDFLSKALPGVSLITAAVD